MWAAALLLVPAAALYTVFVLRVRRDQIDLEVYAWAARTVREVPDLYAQQHPTLGLEFTYPPFAAALFTLIEPIGGLTPAAWTGIALLAAARGSWIVAGASAARWHQRPTWMVAAVLLAAVLLSEPASETLRLGQINLLLLWLVLEGMLGWGRARVLGGVLVGLACAIKLTPGIFLVGLVLAGRWRAAAAGAATVVASIGVAWLVLPAGSSESFWSGALLASERVGDASALANQSLHGTFARLAEPGAVAWWVVPALVLGGSALALARRSFAHSEPVLAVGLVGLAGLMLSPMSWSHHWVFALPLLAGILMTRGHRSAGPVVIAAASYVALGSRVIHRPDVPAWVHETYLVVAVALLLVSARVLQSLAAAPSRMVASRGEAGA